MQCVLSGVALIGCVATAGAAPDFALPRNEGDEPGLKESHERATIELFGRRYLRSDPLMPATGHEVEFAPTYFGRSFLFGGSGLADPENQGAGGGSSAGFSGGSGVSGPAGQTRVPVVVPPAFAGTPPEVGSANEFPAPTLDLSPGVPADDGRNAGFSPNGEFPGAPPSIVAPTIQSGGQIGGGPADGDPMNAAPVPAGALLAGAGIACLFAVRALRAAVPSLAVR
jgi:hypothetical protein